MSINQDDITKLNSVTTGEFVIEASRDNGDSSPPPLSEITSAAGQQNHQIDYSIALSGFWKFADMMIGILAKQTKGRIEYTNLTDAEIKTIAMQSAQSPHFRQLAAMENAPTWLVCVSAIGTFGSHIKVNPKEEKKSENKKLELTPEDIQILSKISKNNDGQKLAEQIKKIPESKIREGLNIPEFEPIVIDDLMDEDERKIKAQLFGNGDLTPEMLEKIKLQKAKDARELQKSIQHAENSDKGGVKIAK